MHVDFHFTFITENKKFNGKKYFNIVVRNNFFTALFLYQFDKDILFSNMGILILNFGFNAINKQLIWKIVQ